MQEGHPVEHVSEILNEESFIEREARLAMELEQELNDEMEKENVEDMAQIQKKKVKTKIMG